MTTTPPTVSPSPSRSATPRRISGPTATSATSSTRIGLPLARSSPTTIFAMSRGEETRPRLRTTYSVPASSMTRPPASPLPLRTASSTRLSGTFQASSRLGSTSTWYCLTKPPTAATSETPGTDSRW